MAGAPATPLRRLLHDLFEASLLLKGLFSLGEVLTGLALFRISNDTIHKLVLWLTAGEISQDPNDLIARLLLAGAQSFSIDVQTFYAAYLASHGAIKLAIVLLLARGKLWAYPLAMAVFSGFIVYQMHRYVMQPGIGLILLSLLDLGVVILTLIEYRALKQRTR